MKYVKGSIMSDKIAYEGIENTAKKSQKFRKSDRSRLGSGKIIRSDKGIILWLLYEQGQISERFKLNDNFEKMVNQFDNSDLINAIYEVIVVLKIHDKRKIIQATAYKNEAFY